jgi:hypothetical protein
MYATFSAIRHICIICLLVTAFDYICSNVDCCSIIVVARNAMWIIVCARALSPDDAPRPDPTWILLLDTWHHKNMRSLSLAFSEAAPSQGAAAKRIVLVPLGLSLAGTGFSFL